MKKFLVTLIVIILAVSVGFGVFYLVRDTEVISLGTASLYKDIDDSFEVSLDMKDPNSYTTVEVISSDNQVLEVIDDVRIDREKGIATGTFKAVAGGNATITFKTNNAKFRNITCDIVVCDGSETFPFRIDTAEELQQIGTGKYGADKSYTLNANIDLGVLDHTFNPLPSFSGTFDGAGYTISNLIVREASASSIGLFQSVAATGTIKNIKFDGADIEVGGSTVSAGVVAGDNYGTVKLIEVISSTFTCPNPNTFMGGIVGRNISTNRTTERQVARIDRCSANVQLGTDTVAVKGTVGGVVGLNNGGVIINSYAKGDAYAKDAALFGGIVGENKYLAITTSGELGYNGNMGAKVKDCYSIVNIHDADATKMGHIVAKDTDSENLNKFVGNYYLVREDETLLGCGAADINYSGTQKGTTAEYESAAGLKTIIARISYIYYEKMAQVNGNKVEIVENTSAGSKTHYWNSTVWEVSSTKNDGYPTLTFKDEYVDDNFDNSTSGDLIKTAEDLKNIERNMSGAYFIDSNVVIDLSGQEWSPIGYGTGTTNCTAFNGSLTMLDGAKITGLTITTKSYYYAGLFGILGESAELTNIVIENVNITSANNTLTGALAGQSKGSILKCTVNNGTLNATSKAGGIVGENKGNITEALVTSGENSSLVIKVVESADRTYAGGIAGHNFASALVFTSKVKTNVKVTSNSLAYLGGITGYNGGKIASSLLSVTRSDYGVITSSKADVGGIAGHLTGTIIDCRVQSGTITASTSAEGSNAGGITGSIMAPAAFSISGALVEDVYIAAHNAGGIAARLNTSYTATLSISQDSGWNFSGDMYVTNIADLSSDIISVGVESATTIAGNIVGGFVAIMEQGIISNSYVKATLSGSNNAGFVWSISYDASSQTGGVIYDSYSSCKATGGSSHAVSNSQIHNTWKALGFLGNQESDRTVGIIFDYAYVERDGMANPTIPDPLSNKTSHCKSDSDMKKTGTFSYLSDNYWIKTDGSYPTLIDVEVLKEVVA